LLFKKPKAGDNTEKTGQKETISQKGGLTQITEAQLDSDNDGLKDWEEKLWGTDPNNPDTDGDGVKDGEELKQGRDPLKPGPDDKLAQFQSLPRFFCFDFRDLPKQLFCFFGCLRIHFPVSNYDFSHGFIIMEVEPPNCIIKQA